MRRMSPGSKLRATRVNPLSLSKENPTNINSTNPNSSNQSHKASNSNIISSNLSKRRVASREGTKAGNRVGRDKSNNSTKVGKGSNKNKVATSLT